MVSPRYLLWVDGSAAGAVGVAMLALAPWLSTLYGLPAAVLYANAAVNLAYACYSLPLALAARRSRRQVTLLVVGNAAWVPVCLAAAWYFRDSASGWGLAHFLGEAIFVGWLAWQEGRQRESLVR